MKTNSGSLPYSEEAEKGILGSIMQDPESCLVICERKFNLDPTVFYDLKYRLLFKLMLELRKLNRVIDSITVSEFLRAAEKLEAFGGLTYVSTIYDWSPSSAHISYYIDIVLEQHVLRRLRLACNDILAAADGSRPLSEVLEDAEGRILNVRAAMPNIDEDLSNLHVVQAIKTRIREIKECGKRIGYSTGLAHLDRMMGALLPQNYICIAASTGVGKTSLALNILQYVTFTMGEKSALISLEMSKLEILQRLACTMAMVDGTKIERGELSTEEDFSVDKYLDELAKDRLLVSDAGALTLNLLQNKVRYMYSQKQVRFFALDYIQLVRGTRDDDSKNESLTKISNGIKQLAKELAVPFLVLSQLNRDPIRERRPPTLSDLRECGAIEQDSDKVILLHRTGRSTDERNPIIEAIVAKNRNGEIGKVELEFQRRYTKFRQRSIFEED